MGPESMNRLALIALAMLIAAPVGLAQSPVTVSYDEIVACAKAINCRNMTTSRITFSDAIAEGSTFTLDGTTYQLHVSRIGLEIIMTLRGESTSSRLVTIGPQEQVISASLRGDGARSIRRTPEEQAAWERDLKRYSNGERSPMKGEEFRSYWQDLARSAMSAIRKQIAK